MKNLQNDELKRGIDSGDASSMVELGRRHCYGVDAEKNFDKAKDLFQRAADQQDADGEAWLARCYATGKGVDKDRQRSTELFKRAASKGNLGAQTYLGAYFAMEDEPTEDSLQATKYLQIAADNGIPTAQYLLALMAESGIGIEKDVSKAISLCESASKNGEPNALAWLGYHYEHGKDVSADFSLALDLYKKAAAKGNIDGCIGWYKLSSFVEDDANRKNLELDALFKLADCGNPCHDREPQDLDFECEVMRQNDFDAEALIQLAQACDLNGDFDKGLDYARKCALSDDFSALHAGARSDILMSIFFRQNNACTEYFEALTLAGTLQNLSTKKLAVFIPSGDFGYSPALREEILNCIGIWNSALLKHFEVCEATSEETANLRFVPCNPAIFGETCDARTYHPLPRAKMNAFNGIKAIFKKVKAVATRDPFSQFLTSGQQELLAKRHRAVILLPIYACKSKDDLTNFRKICLHEIGHALGLGGHSIFRDDVMSLGWTHKATLSKRDEYAITKLYSESASANITETIEANIARGNKYAMRRMGIHQIRNNRYLEGVRLLETASAQNDPEAQAYLGICYGTGRGVSKNIGKAIELLENSITSGFPLAHSVMANCYLMGVGVAQDPQKAAPLLEYAAKYGDLHAAKMFSTLCNLGRLGH